MEKHKKDITHIFKSKFRTIFVLSLLIIVVVSAFQAVKKIQQKQFIKEAEQNAVSDELQEKTFGLIISLKVPFVPEGNLSSEQIEAQRDAISEAQEALIEEFGDRVEVYKVFTSLPALAVKADAKVYEELRQHPLVTSISEDLPDPAN